MTEEKPALDVFEELINEALNKAINLTKEEDEEKE